MTTTTYTDEIFLHPGEYAVATKECVIHTLLGSCVAITLWHPVHKIGAMSHFILPSRGARIMAGTSGRYGDEVLDVMIKELERAGINAKECEARIYGGGNMFPNPAQTAASNVGQKNGEMARAQLIKRGIPVRAESLFGEGHRKVVFDVETGEVKCQQIRLAHSAQSVHATIQSYEKSLTRQPVAASRMFNA
jgi:chemotaxis protein CheD